MPWIANHNGDPVYKASIYAKEELPTWYEIYAEFWKQTIFNYSVEDDREMDAYWKMPHAKYILLIVCNQFNKMLFEDNLIQDVIDELKDHPSLSGLVLNDIRVTCEHFPKDSSEMEKFAKRLNVGMMVPPPIYRLPLPTGQENPFETNYDRIDAPDGDFFIYPILNGTVEDKPVIYELSENSGERSDVIELMMRWIRRYFEGGIGWKDENGDLISDGKSGHGCPSGYDPAM